MTDPLVAAGLTAEGTFAADALLAGDYPRSTRIVTLTGGPYTRGTLLGNITASNKRTKCLNAAVDDSNTPESVLAADADGSAADVQAIVYLTGEFNTAAMVIDGALTAATIKEQLRKIGIFLRGVLAA